MSHGEPVEIVKFSLASTLFASCSDNGKIWDAATGAPVSTIPGHRFAIQGLALSSESSRVAAVLSDRTIWLWDSGSAELIDCFDESEGYFPQLEFSHTGTRLAYLSGDGIVKLRDGISGRFIADLQSEARKFKFSGDGSRIA
ncbi:hypothetical protein M378DRAFT_86929, partial [Amanita muscaria Koide BX008]